MLLLVMDTTRADRCSFLGYTRPTTPRLEAFAAECVAYEQAWSPSSWTYPAHAALFTGRTPAELGMSNDPQRQIAATQPTLAGLLSRAGYATACFSGNPWLSKATGLVRGFGNVEELGQKYEDPPASETHAAARAWMREQRRAGKPFLTFVNDMEPHRPRRAPGPIEQRFLSPGTAPEDVEAVRGISLPVMMIYSLGIEPYPAGMRRADSDLYDAEVANLDEEIGALLDGMREDGLLDGTIVVIAGDHGEGLGDHGWVEHGTMVWRELLHVPMLVRHPDGAGAGTRVADLVRLQDLFPTILVLCGVAVPEGISARTLTGDLSGRVATATEFPLGSWCEAAGAIAPGPAVAALRRHRRSASDGEFHLIADDRAPPRLYDLRADPGETTDLAAERPDDVARLLRLLP